MKVITLLNEKGGVGKTTLSVHLAALLALNGSRVVLIDADGQGNATLAFGFQKEPAFYDLIVRGATFKSTLRFVSPEIYEWPGRPTKGQLFLLPSNVETRNIANSISDSFAVLRRLKEISTAVDYVVFDTSPTPSLLHGSIYIATDAILYPTKCETWSFDGLVESFSHRDAFMPYRQQFGMREIINLGIVPTMYQNNTAEHRDNLAELREAYPDGVWKPLAMRTVWRESARMARPVWTIEPSGKAAAEVSALVNGIEERLKHVV